MHANFKLWLVIGITLLALTGCGPFGQSNSTPATSNMTNTATPPPSVTDTATLLPATEAPAPPITGLHMLNANYGWAWANSGQLLRTADGGQTWMDRTPGAGIGPEGSFYLDSQTAWQEIYFQGSSRFGLLHTSDDGQTWKQISYDPQNSNGQASILHFTDALNGWAESADVGAGNAYITLSSTKDGGKTWAIIPVKAPTNELGLPAGIIHLCSICEDSFYYDPERIIIVYGDEASMESMGAVRMQVSFDLGNTWLTRTLPLPKNNLDAAVGSAYPTFFSSENGLMPVQLIKMDNKGNPVYQRLAFYATQDGGASWSLLPGILDNVGIGPQMQVISPKDILVVCGNALFASHDGAQTWKQLESNLDFSRTDTRTVSALDFVDANTGWALIQQNENSLIYRTSDGGVSWNQLNPLLAVSTPATVTLDANIPTPTPLPTQTLEPTPTPDVVFDSKANAYRIQFAPGATWVDVSGILSANLTKHFVLSAMQGQVMSVSVRQGPAFPIEVAGADKKVLSNNLLPRPLWRGVLPSSQDYFVTVESRAAGPFTLRVAINPPGQTTQNFEFDDPAYAVVLGYTDEFAPMDWQFTLSTKGTPLVTLYLIALSLYYPHTNLDEAAVLLTATTDPAIVSTCTQPSTQPVETLTGQETVNGYTFTRSEVTGAAAGNVFDQIFYRTALQNKCFEVVFVIHSSPIGIYPPGTVVEFDRAALLGKFEAMLNSFGAK